MYAGTEETRVINENIDPAEVLRSRLHNAPCVFQLSDIAGAAVALPPAAQISDTTRSTSVWFRAQMKTFAPSRA
jgi:hypothetical protein